MSTAEHTHTGLLHCNKTALHAHRDTISGNRKKCAGKSSSSIDIHTAGNEDKDDDGGDEYNKYQTKNMPSPSAQRTPRIIPFFYLISINSIHYFIFYYFHDDFAVRDKDFVFCK